MGLMPMRDRWSIESPIAILAAGIGFIILFTSLCGCGAPPGLEGDKKFAADLTEQFSVITPRNDSEAREFYAHFPVTRKGIRKDSMVLTAPTAIQASLAGFTGPVRLRGAATPVFNVGDGIQLELFLREDAARKCIYSRYFDAGRLAEDRDWISLSAPLELKDSTDNWLEVQISGGPQGDLTADWLALSAIHIEPK